MERPEIVTDQHLNYLDDLRESGSVNMFGAGPFLQESFDLSRNEAREIVAYWMNSFGDENR